LLDWITSKLVAIFEQDDIRQHMGNLVVSEADTSEGVTLPRGKTSLYDGKLWIVQSIQEHMTKVQVSGQFEGMTKPDHILEFVLTSGTELNKGAFANNVYEKRKNYQMVDGLRMETLSQLYMGNRNALMDRTPESTREYTHKYYNHIQRLKFLNMFCSEQFPVEDIPEYLVLLLVLKRQDTWMRLAVQEHTVNEVKQNLYGNLYVKLVTHLSSIKMSSKRDMHAQIFHASILGPLFKKVLTRGDINTVPELLRHFDKPDYYPFKKKTTRKCHGQDCVVMGGRKRKRTRR